MDGSAGRRCATPRSARAPSGSASRLGRAPEGTMLPQVSRVVADQLVVSASGSASVPNMAPNRSTTVAGHSPPTLNRSVASSSSGPSGAHACHARINPDVLERPARVEDRRLRQRHGRNTNDVTTRRCHLRRAQLQNRSAFAVSSHSSRDRPPTRRWHSRWSQVRPCTRPRMPIPPRA
jgi:hypothetical protein